MNLAQMTEAARKDGFNNKEAGGAGYGACISGNVHAFFVPTSSKTKYSNWKGRVTWEIDGKRATKAEVKALIG